MIYEIARPPRGFGTDATSVRYYTVAAASKVSAVPDDWYDEMVTLTAVGGVVHWFISNKADAVVDNTVSPTDGGASGATVGSRLANGSSLRFKMPSRPAPSATDTDGKLYLVRQSTGDFTVILERS